MIRFVILTIIPTLTLSLITTGTIQQPHFHCRLAACQARSFIQSSPLRVTNRNDSIDEKDVILDPQISSQFKILACSSTSCAKRTQMFGLDEYALISGLYQRKEHANASQVTVEETSCLGCCKVGPCVGIEHEDYYGTVALEGMKPNEFSDRVFQK